MTDYVFPVRPYRGTVALHWNQYNGGSDLFAPRGADVLAIHAGTVIEAGSSAISGNYVWIKGDDGLQSFYAHGDAAPSVRTGQRVAAGTYLMPVGDSGNAKGAGTHCHFGMGRTIIDGGGPTGGCGTDFDAVGLLRRLLAGTPSTPAPAPKLRRFRAPSGGLRLRVSPGLDSKVIRELDAGEVVSATMEPSYNWRRIRTTKGEVGWTADDFLEEVT